MITTKTKKYTLVKPTSNSVSDFLTTFNNSYSELTGNHLIIDLSEKFNITIEELMLFLEVSTQHRNNGTSFVVICNGVDIDDVPDEINVVPTLTEAIDILEMDAIERDLGF
jgi:hypothetical protein